MLRNLAVVTRIVTHVTPGGKPVPGTAAGGYRSAVRAVPDQTSPPGALQGLFHLQGFSSVCKDFIPSRGFATAG